MDQADTLRRLMRERLPFESRKTLPDEPGALGIRPAPATPVVTIASGKGGVGKSCLAANLGASLARAGLRILLVDGDMGLANLDILFNVQPQATIEQVLAGQARPQDAILGLEPNLWLLPAASGMIGLRHAEPAPRARAVELFSRLPWEMDLVLVDVGAGISPAVLSLHHPVQHSLVVLTSEPTSLTDAYGLIKLLRRTAGIDRFAIVVNQVADGREGRLVHQRLSDVAARFMADVRLEYLGHWARDEKVIQSVMKRKILLDLDSGAESVPSLELLAKRLRLRCLGELKAGVGESPVGGRLTAGEGMAGFWKTLLAGERV